MDEEDTKITGARRGTLMHLFLQKINLKEEYDYAKLENLREKLIAKAYIVIKQFQSFFSLFVILNTQTIMFRL
mgnify:CR=1 FL=1